MRKIILCLTTILLLFAACEKTCIGKKPKELKPIDWENYNDVYTVYWNYYNECRETKKEENKDILVSGWIQGYYGPGHDFFLRDNPDMEGPRIVITMFLEDLISENAFKIASKLDTCDLSKKCFIKGKLFFYNESDNGCCWINPIIYLNGTNNIYFE